MENLKIISVEMTATKEKLIATERRLRDATTRRDGLLAEVQGIDAAIDGAELAHAVALAGVELGESDNSRDTAVALDTARESASRKPELIQQRRVADAVIDGLTRQHEEAHSRYVVLAELHRAAQVAYIEAQAQKAMDATREAITQVTNAVAEAAAVRRVLESIGGRWSLGNIEVNNYSPMFNPDRAAVELMAAALFSEIA